MDLQYQPLNEKAQTLKGLIKHSVVPAISGYVACLIVLYCAHFFLISSDELTPSSDPHFITGATDPFNPLKCQRPPTDCWDSYMKKGGYSCVKVKQDTLLRNQFLLKAGERSCYKAVYYNLERTTFIIASIFIFWAILVFKAVERIASALFVGKLRYSFTVAILFNMWSLWYSSSILIHYFNDAFYEFFYSQLYFSLSDLVVFICGTYLLVQKTTLPIEILSVCLGINAFHIIELLLDEHFLIFNPNFGLVLRNLALFFADFLFIVSVWSLKTFKHAFLYSKRKILYTILGSIVFNFTVFRLLFADHASFAATKDD
ncbi:hypothetical protein MP638_001364 [Amoeboaphelidium occidentale]|nr:hypothetical protein MP638_001364 [Amoeboaphelidium occidentale]